MKKVLFATTALVMTAGYAAADVSIDGYGRFGLSYYQKGHLAFTSKNAAGSDNVEADNSKTWMEQRLRFNIKASTETDGGVEFGGKVRMQYDDGGSESTLNAAQLYFSYEGAMVQVGNTDTALDKNSAGLFKGSELGLTDTSFGNSRSSYYGYSSNKYSESNRNRSGIYASYGIAGVKVEASYVDPNQYGENANGTKSEKSFVASYVTGELTLSGGGTKDGAGIEKNNIWYVAGAYDFTEEFRAGLTYIHEGKDAAGFKLGKTTTVYGSYTTGPVKLQAYVANYSGFDDEATPNGAGYKSKTVYGLGGNYDLGGGTTLRAGLHRDGYKETYGEFGVKFNF